MLEIGDEEPFVSRPMEGAPEPKETVVEHLLDGQQRLTALWRSLYANYPDRTFFVRFEEDPDHPGPPVPVVYGQRRWRKKGQRRPAWAEDPAGVHKRELIPLDLCRPGDEVDPAEWCRTATGGDLEAAFELMKPINELRSRVASYNIPFLGLPAGTPKDVALDVFIKLNTSSVRLSAFDIVVAQFEERTGQSLHDLVTEVHSAVPGLVRYRDPEDVVLDVAALREYRSPSQASYFKLDLDRVAEEWQEIIDGLAFVVELLEEEKVFDAERLPTVAVLPVVAAIHSRLPTALDEHGNARALLKRYLWRSFLTPRYESSAGSRALQDLRGLIALVEGKEEQPPIFDDEEYPIPDEEAFLRAGWPKTKDILARGTLAVCLHAGGLDLADGVPATAESVTNREYHHLFPDSILTKKADLSRSKSFRALNCALLTWNTNRNISAKSPLQYLRERVERSDLGEAAVRERLGSHLIPYEELAAAGFEGVSDSDLPGRVAADYDAFLEARAALVAKEAASLCGGQG